MLTGYSKRPNHMNIFSIQVLAKQNFKIQRQRRPELKVCVISSNVLLWKQHKHLHFTISTTAQCLHCDHLILTLTGETASYSCLCKCVCLYVCLCVCVFFCFCVLFLSGICFVIKEWTTFHWKYIFKDFQAILSDTTWYIDSLSLKIFLWIAVCFPLCIHMVKFGFPWFLCVSRKTPES